MFNYQYVGIATYALNIIKVNITFRREIYHNLYLFSTATGVVEIRG